MRLKDRRALEAVLRNHYRAASRCGEEPAPAATRALIRLVAEEMARPVRPHAAVVVASQVRYIGIVTWVLHAALVLFAALLTLSGLQIASAMSAIGAACALASLTEIPRSRSFGMAELEASCPVNAQAVVCARALVLGCVDALVLVVLSMLVTGGVGLGMTFVQACAPYLLAAGAGLFAARRVASADATIAAVVAAAGVCAGCVVLRMLCPTIFESAAGLAWWVAAALALVFAAAEARAWFRAAGTAFTEVPARAVSTL